ncbi:hypothetical protein SCHPADRAFT_947229 [Schizopora paradoxa]|uniref:Uncharacterized protein n=1 Tax=Schizopora paradoxa TaxID=27342 RepID=A0A0H2QZV3_9AGAM|nr:hypothetical protein SCHPADRAFT_947229 [Schizopora paradoxa]
MEGSVGSERVFGEFGESSEVFPYFPLSPQLPSPPPRVRLVDALDATPSSKASTAQRRRRLRCTSCAGDVKVGDAVILASNGQRSTIRLKIGGDASSPWPGTRHSPPHTRIQMLRPPARSVGHHAGESNFEDGNGMMDLAART